MALKFAAAVARPARTPYGPAMRVTEILLLSLPAILLALWFMGLRHASMRSFMIAALLLAALGGALMWFGERRTFIGNYHPAHLHDGQVVP
jgi:undecaprenyl pyrophosphate phosphatase UppP